MEAINPRALYDSNYDAPRNVTRRAIDRALRDMHVLRDEFAALVMQAVVAHHGMYDEEQPAAATTTATDFDYDAGTVAAVSYVYADAMLKAKFDSMTWDSKK